MKHRLAFKFIGEILPPELALSKQGGREALLASLSKNPDLANPKEQEGKNLSHDDKTDIRHHE